LIRLALLWGASFNAGADQVTAAMEGLRREFGISEASILEAIKASPLLSEVWANALIRH
jgi:hypothetical protein